MEKSRLIVKYALRLLTAVQAYVYPAYATVLRLVKLESEQSAENVQKAQSVCAYWLLCLLISGVLVLLSEFVTPILLEPVFRLCLFWYLTRQDFAGSQLLYRGVLAQILPQNISVFNLITPGKVLETIATPRIQQKKTSFLSSKSIAQDSPKLVVDFEE